MNKLVLLGAGAVVAAATAVIPPDALADPAASANAQNVTNIPYAQAIRILKSQGARYVFGGSVGSDVPQSQCVVSKQTLIPGGKYRLNLDCTKAAADSAAGNAAAAPAPVAPRGAGGPGAAGAPGAAPAPGSGQGTYGSPVGVPVPVG